MVSFTHVAAVLFAATTVTAATGQTDCSCKTLDANGNVMPDDAGVTKGCAGRGQLVTRTGTLDCYDQAECLYCIVTLDGTQEDDVKSKGFISYCSLHGKCGKYVQ
ncbi:uncharacterized protein LY79DRAFT_563233 [Colletotrichum navitas]|uniref:Uncharacterized protein n=1 Tax=Colletotrichum navitas TaxID=681940 RepID=A0AAD8PSI1_9PEZI|nr:uncharacterized protein LY79DRAFT_563233 [Colletotrichum navitas]KAK1579901.1 hypothetical protein LY79DRAFT_563233 [Colletotrichum navitas]